MTKIHAAAVLLWTTQFPFKVQAWAPIGNLPYAQLPKTLEFAEKVIWLPKADELNGVQQRLPQEQRTLPWMHQDKEEDLQTNFFFDGYSGTVNEWPTREAFLLQEASQKKKVTSKVEAMETLDYFYDGMGNLINWDVPRNPDELYYFDGVGASHVWSSSEVASPVQNKEAQPKKEALEAADYYYDDMGNAVSWSIPSQDEKHYFDGIGASQVWSSAAAKPKAILKNKEALEAADYYYDDMGNLVNWSVPSQNEKHYFDGIGASQVWSSATAKTEAIPKNLNKEEALEVADHYYDDMGNLVSWSVPSQDEKHYFDGIGSSHVWLSAKPKTQAILKNKEEALEVADHYYDDMGNLVNWSVPKQQEEVVAEEKHYFEDIGTSRVWQRTIDVLSTTTQKLLQKDAMLNNLGIIEDCAQPYYSDTGDLMCWVGA